MAEKKNLSKSFYQNYPFTTAAAPNPFANLIPPPGVMFPPTQQFIPPFPVLPPFMMPPPMPPNLDTLTEDELRLLEGNERRNIEARIKVSFQTKDKEKK